MRFRVQTLEESRLFKLRLATHIVKQSSTPCVRVHDLPSNFTSPVLNIYSCQSLGTDYQGGVVFKFPNVAVFGYESSEKMRPRFDETTLSRYSDLLASWTDSPCLRIQPLTKHGADHALNLWSFNDTDLPENVYS